MAYTSALWNDATRLYQPWEVPIESWDRLVEEINRLGDCYRAEDFVWRGQSDARWGLKSSLYRTVADQLGRVPSETELSKAEERLLCCPNRVAPGRRPRPAAVRAPTARGRTDAAP